MTDLLLCYSIAPCTSKGCISTSDICHLWRFLFSFNMYVGLNRLPLAALVAYPMALSFYFAASRVQSTNRR